MRPGAAARARRVAFFLGVLAVAAGVVEARAGTAPTPRPIALTAPPRQSGAAPAVARSPKASAGASNGPPPTVGGPTSSTRRSFLGAPIDVGYGIVQVRVVLHGARIADVVAVQLPTGGRSSDISSFAEPILRAEVLSRQNASIDTVSGASYTSDGYARSVQAALDSAGLH